MMPNSAKKPKTEKLPISSKFSPAGKSAIAGAVVGLAPERLTFEESLVHDHRCENRIRNDADQKRSLNLSGDHERGSGGNRTGTPRLANPEVRSLTPS